MHLFYTARDITSHALGTIVSAMGPYGALGALGSSALAYLLLQMVMGLRATVPDHQETQDLQNSSLYGNIFIRFNLYESD